MSIALVDLFVYLLGLLLHGGNFTIDWISRSTMILIWSISLYRLIGDRYRRALRLLSKGWWLMLLCVLTMYVLVSLISAYPTPIAERIEDVPLSMLMVAMMELTVIIIIRVLHSTLEAKENQLREETLQNRLFMAESQYVMMTENIQQIRRLRHDMRHHMNIIMGFLEQENYKGLQEYLEEYQTSTAALDTELPLYTKNQPVNILAGYYAKKAQDEGIRTEFSIRLPENLPIDPTQMTVILGNLWQNALEACQGLPENTDRWIRTSIALHQSKFMLHCSNSAAHVRQDSKGRFLSTKGHGHGAGLACVEDITALHHGFCECKFDGAAFSVSVVLPLSPETGGAAL